jgi:hypothetical protein
MFDIELKFRPVLCGCVDWMAVERYPIRVREDAVGQMGWGWV